ncbi:Trypsin-1 [Orchesella cincta]|uniref:Trypsin-1 n=1 Tax=Orchesella cincta TaxID=48709 RepID=A0A1D2M6J6_ORCCI|nr:Trypsin-1 [Orchesella cincta]
MSSEMDFASRIIGGMNATSRQIPYQLRLLVKTTAKKRKACGAALVEAFGVQFALTAGHCIRDDPLTTAADPDNMLLTAGKYNLKISSSSTQLRNPVSAIMHELYKPYTNDRTYDIAILFFEPPFKLSSKVKTIELPEYLWAQPAKVEISGWGSTTGSSKPKTPDILQVLEIRTMDNEECKYSFESKINKVTEKMMCLLNPGVKVGDSGGPARALNTTNGRSYLAGLSSYHLGACGNGRSPSVYTRVSAYVNWIQNQVNDYLLADYYNY